MKLSDLGFTWRDIVSTTILILLVAGVIMFASWVVTVQAAPCNRNTTYVVYNEHNEVVREVLAAHSYSTWGGLVKLYTCDHIEIIQLGAGWRVERIQPQEETKDE